MPRNALHVEILDEDLEWAVKQDQGNCAIVRAIQRKIPSALRVTVNKDTIRFSLPDEVSPDGTKGVRYIFETPRDVVNKVIRPFDEGKGIEAEARTFSLTHAIDARPIRHISDDQRRKHNEEERYRHRRNRTGRQRPSPQHHTYGRFLDSLAEEASQDDAS